MSLRNRFLEIAFAAATMCLCPIFVSAQSTANDTNPEPGTGSITGRVISDGQGVAEATVFASGSITVSQPRTTKTDSNGNFVFDDLNRGLYSLAAAAPGLIMPPREPDTPATLYRLGDSAQLTLIKGGVITGTVLSAAGEPVVLVRVRATLVTDANGRPSFAGYPRERFTDDRGMYRLYGLPPGTYVVSAAGGSSFGGNSAYDGDPPIYAPSSTRDNAAQIVVSSGNETTGVDIKYRREIGHAISGMVTGQPGADTASISLSLSQVIEDRPAMFGWSYIPPGEKTFAFFGVGDGDYDLRASRFSQNDSSASEIKRITVKGADVTGIELNLKPYAVVTGRVALIKSDLPACKDKREPLFAETLVTLRTHDVRNGSSQARLPDISSQAVIDKTGEFKFKNLSSGQYQFSTRFFAKYWYLKSIVRPNTPASGAVKSVVENAPVDLAKNGLNLKFGDNVSNVTISLAEGAASLHGTIKPAAGERRPGKLFAYLVPAEKEAAEDVLRFFVAEVGDDGAFALNNLPAGRYWAITQTAADNETQIETKLRLPSESVSRVRLRRDAETAKLPVELKPCQNITEFSLPVIVSSHAQ